MRNAISRSEVEVENRGGAGKRGSSAIALAVAATLCASAAAQEQHGVLEEIIVTAQKREQNIQDVGISISAFSGEQMRALGFQDSKDIARVTPGVYIGGSIGGQTSLFTIRGITQNDFNDWVEAPVAVYIDDAYIAMAQGQSFATFDTDRIEIAKGPQGTLFGRNATGGMIHYLTKKPTREFEGYVDLTGAENSQFRAEAAISGPLGDKLSARLSLMYDTYDELLNNKYPGGLIGEPGVTCQGQD